MRGRRGRRRRRRLTLQALKGLGEKERVEKPRETWIWSRKEDLNTEIETSDKMNMYRKSAESNFDFKTDKKIERAKQEVEQKKPLITFRQRNLPSFFFMKI